ncbi:uncharacterized protein LOC143295668 [Babylonia areolata]|uniref:uncharacterized protein LOC143295668 n=1 Tax=Babylonia areolata TaxID=304850 RepID=UPI003FD169A3
MGPPGTKIFIGNLPDDCDVDRLRSVFETVGTVVEMDVIKNYGFAHFQTEKDAQKAVTELNDTEFDGKTIKVEQSRSTVRHKPGMGSMTECYRCGKSGHWSKDCPAMSGRGGPRGRGRGRGVDRGPYRDPYDDYYADPYYRRRYLPPPPAYERYSPYDPYERRRLALARDPYYLERERDYYDRLAARDAYYDYYARRAYAAETVASRPAPRDPRDAYAPPPRSDPAVSRSRVPGPY